MKIKIIKSVSFVLILTVILILLSRLFSPKNNSVEAGMHNRGASGILAEPDNTIDYIVLGNSEGYSSISPMEIWNEYGYTGYVCCSPEQSLPLSVRIIGEATKHQKPKIVMLEASSIHITSDLSDASDQALNYVLKVFQYHDRWKNLKKEDFLSKPKYDTVNCMKGYEFSDVVAGCEEEYSEKSDESTPTAIPKSNQMYLKMINKICKNNGAKFVIVSIPTFKYWKYETHEAIQNFCDKNGIEYYDMNMIKDEVAIDWEKDTCDEGEHLNYSGAKKTTKHVGKHLNKEGTLQNHKGDEKYKHWDKQYEEYKSRVHTKQS